MALFAVCAQGSAVWPYAAWPYGAHLHAPITQYSSYPAIAPIAYAHHGYPAHVAAPALYSHYHAAPAVVPVAKVAASYTAATRGAVHTAPLEGHAISQTSLNLAPAPGTL